MPFPILHAIKHFPHYRAQLKVIRTDPRYSAKTVLDIDIHILKQQGIQVLALDFDGVLAYHGADKITPVICDWLQQCSTVFGEDHIYLHSNNNRPLRLQFLQQHFPQLHILRPTHKKPFPHGLHSITENTGIAPNQIVLIDDRLTTGILAACLAGCQPLHITQPYTNYRHAPIQEAIFCFLRWLENFLTR